MSWLATHEQLIGSAASVGMLLLWGLYLHLFLATLRRQRRPAILINPSEARGWDSRCLVCNMSAEVIYVEAMVLSLHAQDGVAQRPVTDLRFESSRELERNTARDVHGTTRQGPLRSGSVMDMGSFRSMATEVLSSIGCGDEERRRQALAKVTMVGVEVIAVYAAESRLCGARRSFNVRGRGGRAELEPVRWYTEQIRSRRGRNRLGAALEEDQRLLFGEDGS